MPQPKPRRRKRDADNPEGPGELAVFDEDVPRFYEEQDGARDVNVTLGEDHTTRIKGTHTFVDLSASANAARQLDRLPVVNESIHGIMRGNFAGFDFIAAVLRLVSPRKIKELNIATLGFNDKNTDALLAMMDAGHIEHVTFICSHFYRSNEGETYDRLHHELTSRGSRCLAMRCHAKLLIFELAPKIKRAKPQGIVLEMSANLRSCNNLEQFVMTGGMALVQLHRGWMDRVLTDGGE